MEDVETLMEFGMSKSEAKIYITLLKHGPLTSGKIVTLSRQHISVSYYALHRLLEKGFVTYTKKGRFYEYFVTNPDVFLDKLKSMTENLEAKMPVWKRYAKLAEGKVSVEIFEGIKGLQNLFNQTLKTARKGDSYRVFTLGNEFENEELVSFFKKIVNARTRLGVKTLVICDKAYKNIFHKIKDPDYISKINLRFVSFKFPQGVIIFQDNIIFLSWIKDPKAVHIKYARLAEQYAKFFDELYERGEPY